MRVKGGPQGYIRHKKVLKITKGQRGSKHLLFRRANEAMLKSLWYATRDRRVRKRDLRKLWIARINAAAPLNGTTGLAYFLMMHATTYLHFVGLMVMIGLSNPTYQVGADAMLADMIPSEKRTDAYAINRIANNAAFAIGPAVGGFLAATSYNLAFIGACTGFFAYSMLLFLFARETLSLELRDGDIPLTRREVLRSYNRVFADGGYIAFVMLISLGLIAPLMMWILMPVYAKTNFGIPENLYGWIPTTNALMCVFLQFPLTGITRKFAPLRVAAFGMLV